MSPDRTKLPRPTGDKSLPTYLEGSDRVPIRSAFDQDTQVNASFGQPLLDTYPVQSVENQAAGPSASFEQYDPTGSSGVKRAGLVGQGGAKSPKARRPNVP